MADLLQEIDESLKRDKMQYYWQKYRYAVFAFVAAIIIITIGYKSWQYYEQQTQNHRAFIFHQLQEAIDKDDKDQVLNYVKQLQEQRIDGTAMTATLMSINSLHDKHHADILILVDNLLNTYDKQSLYRPIIMLAHAGLLLQQPQKIDLTRLESDLILLLSTDQRYHGLIKQYLAEISILQGNKQRAITLMDEVTKDTQASSQLQSVSSIVSQMLTYQK